MQGDGAYYYAEMILSCYHPVMCINIAINYMLTSNLYSLCGV